MITIVVPCKDKKEISKEWYKQYDIKYPWMTLLIIEEPNLSLSEARKLGISKVKTKYILNLDSDTILPENYIEQALEILEKNEDVVAVAIDYEKLQGHYAFGTSIWKTDILQQTYDWNGIKEIPICECICMWIHIHNLDGKRMETLPMRAIHLKNRKV